MHAKNKVVRPKQACIDLGISPATLWRLVKQGKLVKVQLSPRCVGFTQDDIALFLANARQEGAN